MDCNVGSPFVKLVEEVNYMQNYPRQENNPHSNIYNPSWKNHSNLSQSNNQSFQREPYQNVPPGFQQLEKKPSLKEVLSKLVASSTKALSKIAKASNKFMQQTRKISDSRDRYIEFGKSCGTNCKGTFRKTT